MKNNIFKFIIIFILNLIILNQIIYANSNATVNLNLSKTTYTPNENIEINIEVNNSGVEAGVEDLSGYLEYDKNILELVTIDIEDKIEELKLDTAKQEILEEYVGMLDVLELTEKYIIAGMDENGKYIISIVPFSEEGIIAKTSTNVSVGKIQLKVLSNALNTTTTIKMTEIFVNGDVEISDVSTPQIKIGTGTNNTSITTANSSSSQVGITVVNNTQKQNTSTKNNVTSNNTKTNKTETQQTSITTNSNLPQTGTKDAWPILIVIILSLLLYVNYRRFKDIK